MPKLDSIHDNIMNFEADICVVTETWLQSDNIQINRLLEDYQNKCDIAILRKDRQYQRGGGVAFLYDRTKIDLRSVKTMNSEFELMAAIGRRRGQRKKILLIGVYVPPSYDAETSDRCVDFINDTLVQLRSRYNNPCLLYTSPSPRDRQKSRMPSSA